jgi:hypothetical protein
MARNKDAVKLATELTESVMSYLHIPSRANRRRSEGFCAPPVTLARRLRQERRGKQRGIRKLFNVDAMGKDLLFHGQVIDLLQGLHVLWLDRQQRLVAPAAQALRDVQRDIVELGKDSAVFLGVLLGQFECLGETLQYVSKCLALERSPRASSEAVVNVSPLLMPSPLINTRAPCARRRPDRCRTWPRPRSWRR